MWCSLFIARILLPSVYGRVTPGTRGGPWGLDARSVSPAGGPPHRLTGARLESSSTGSSFPVDSAKPVPLAVVSVDSM
ncbi:basic proline-rich [Labeo rohita]|uniref:Basic proline-rich n=1 Tax=Labeo rohita TaxID=84645 RepID=A0A498P4B9_LABRO|nr:basic proline-rich [Labeo rohita]RXN38599.1 basic proline-rich [Labeo rohita]